MGLILKQGGIRIVILAPFIFSGPVLMGIKC